MTQGWIVDASIAVRWVVAEEHSDRALTLLMDRLVAPDLLWAECANILWKKVTRQALTPTEAENRLAALRRRGIETLGHDALLTGALRRALRHRHAAYDCLYLEAAAATGLPLVTADRRLAALAGDGAAVVLLSDLPVA